MVVTRLIERKRDGGSLSAAEWSALITLLLAGDVPDYQVAALLMAIYFQGLQAEELNALTDAMLASGASLPRGSGASRVDKHSTGGVGDKTSLVVAPVVAACGLSVPMMSGRGLGHTGGTLDKLESIPGFRTSLTLAEAERQVEAIGLAMFGQSEEVAPADRRLYALRDVTGTVESIPLIAASIMSKKLAEGLDALVLDVKTGDGALISDAARATTLARTMIDLGESRGCRVTALLTTMSRPLGNAIGNALEVEEAIEVLHGRGRSDLVQLSVALAAEMLLVGGAGADREAAVATVERALASGDALDKFRVLIEAQGGNPNIVDDPAVLAGASVETIVTSSQAGVVTRMATRALGQIVVDLGGGRRTAADLIDPRVGLLVTARPGDAVARGEPIATVFASTPAAAEQAAARVRDAIEVADAGVGQPPLISARITSAGIEPLA